MEALKEEWAGKNMEERSRITGRIVGVVIFEVATLVLTAGLAVVAKAGKLGKLAKLLDQFNLSAKAKAAIIKAVDGIIGKLRGANAPKSVRGAPTNIGPASAKAPKNVTPGIRELEGHYVDDLGRVQPWRAHYDEYGRLIGRTDYNAGNLTEGIPDIHYHRYEYSSRFPLGREVEKHMPGEFPH